MRPDLFWLRLWEDGKTATRPIDPWVFQPPESPIAVLGGMAGITIRLRRS